MFFGDAGVLNHTTLSVLGFRWQDQIFFEFPRSTHLSWTQQWELLIFFFIGFTRKITKSDAGDTSAEFRTMAGSFHVSPTTKKKKSV